VKSLPGSLLLYYPGTHTTLVSEFQLAVVSSPHGAISAYTNASRIVTPCAANLR
jgi:hypothetical protein